MTGKRFASGGLLNAPPFIVPSTLSIQEETVFEVLRKFQVRGRDEIVNLVNLIQRIERVRDLRDVFIALMWKRTKIVGRVVARPGI